MKTGSGSMLPGSLLNNTQMEISVPSGASGSLKKVGRTFLSGRDFLFFNRLLVAFHQADINRSFMKSNALHGPGKEQLAPGTEKERNIRTSSPASLPLSGKTCHCFPGRLKLEQTKRKHGLFSGSPLRRLPSSLVATSDRRMMKNSRRIAARHRRTRKDHSTETAEDYVEAVAEIHAQEGICRVVDLAARFDVSHVTVTRIVSRLKKEGYLETEPYRPIQLTEKGARLAAESQQRHELVYRFLLAIGVPERIAAIDAEGIEHHVSPETLARFHTLAEERTATLKTGPVSTERRSKNA